MNYNIKNPAKLLSVTGKWYNKPIKEKFNKKYGREHIQWYWDTVNLESSKNPEKFRD